MKTTAVFAEIMAVDLQVMCWIGLAFYAFGAFTTKSIDWATLGDWSALLTTAILALAYTAGVLVDRVADKVVRSPGRRTKDFGTVRLTVYQWGSGMVDFLEYQRSRLRVARSTVLNIAIAGVFGSIAAWQTPWSLGVPLIAIAACLLAWWAFVAIDKSCNERLLEAYELVKDKAPARKAH